MGNASKVSLENLGQVQETLTAPLLARANETHQKNGMLNDKKAVEMVARLDYPFETLNQAVTTPMRMAVFRTLIYDYLLGQLLATQPQATVVELGCGLNTRFERVDNGLCRWFDLDMPDVYQVWQQFFTETERRTFLPYSAFDESWVDVVRQQSQPPYIFIAEASVIFFPEADNRQLFQRLADNFSPCHHIFDTATDAFIDHQDEHPIMRLYDAKMRWAINNVYDIEGWGDTYQIEHHINMLLEPPQPLSHLLPWSFKLMFRLHDVVKPATTRSYFINQARLATSAMQ